MENLIVVPGLGGSGHDHWQSRWARERPGAVRVEQRGWEQPDRDEWVAELDRTVQRVTGPVVLVAHSLGCLAVASTASASSVGYASDGSLVYTAGAGETNSSLVSTSPYSTTCGPVVTPCIDITDWGAFIDTGSLPAGCAAYNQTEGWAQYGEVAQVRIKITFSPKSGGSAARTTRSVVLRRRPAHRHGPADHVAARSRKEA